jgi:tetratricopeptide (TPR) repeat protein
MKKSLERRRSAGFQPATPLDSTGAGKMPALHWASRRLFHQPARGAVVTFLVFFLASLEGNSGQGPSAPSFDLVQLSAEAQQAQRRGDYRRAAAIYKEMLDRQPHLAEVRSNLGLMYHFLGDYKQAVSTFELALHDAPQLYVANLFLGLDLLNLHQPQRALSFLERACDLNKQDAQAQVGLGAAYLALGNRNEARDAYERAALIDPKSPDAWYGLGAVYLDFQESAISGLAEIGKESPYARDLVAHSLVEQGQPDAAINIYRDLLKSKQILPCLGANLGIAYTLAEDLQSAEKEFQNERQGRPGCLLARLGLARVFLEQHNMEKALNELFAIWTSDQNFLRENLPTLWTGLNDDAVSLIITSCDKVTGSQQRVFFARSLASAIRAWQDETYEPLSPSAIVSAVDADKSIAHAGASPASGATPESLLAQGRYTECEHSLQEKRPRMGVSDLKVLCECSYFAGDFRTCFLASGELAEHPPDILPGLYWRAKSAEKLGVAALRHAGLVDPDSARIHFLLGELYRQKYQEDRAKEEYLKVIELRPNDLAAHLGLADAYSISMEFDKAIPELKRVFSLDPHQPDANYLMGNILVSQHRFTEAVPYLETALKGNTPKTPLAHALMSRVYASQGRIKDAIFELRQALPADQDGSLHYQLSMLYRKVGDQEAAAAALEKSKAISRQRKRHTGHEMITESASPDSQVTSRFRQ